MCILTFVLCTQQHLEQSAGHWLVFQECVTIATQSETESEGEERVRRGRVGRRGERERSRGDERDVVLWVLGPEGRVERGETEREKRETSAAGKGLQKAVWGRGARIEGEKCALWSAARHVDGERETGEGVRVQRENLWERCPRGEE